MGPRLALRVAIDAVKTVALAMSILVSLDIPEM